MKLEAEMSSIVIGYRQMELAQMEVHKPVVALFEWSLLGANHDLVAKGHIIVLSESAKVPGWEPGMEYWYVSQVGTAVAPVSVTVECMEVVPAAAAAAIFGKHRPSDAFVATMVPEPQALDANDPVLAQATVQGLLQSVSRDSATIIEAAMWMELDGHRIKRLEWYWSGSTPLSLFPGGASKGDKVELGQTRNGAPGFPKVGWSKGRQVASSVAASL
jgi:hypothetical protein